MSSDKRRVLVTGGCGFIGSNFVRMALAERPDWHIVNFDALTYAGNPENLRDVEQHRRYTFIHGDIRDRDAVTDALAGGGGGRGGASGGGCDLLVHFAAESHVDRSIIDCSPFISTNVQGTQVLLDACRELGTIERFVHVSTDEVYGELPLDEPDLKFAESTPLAPNSPYAASKAASDVLVLAYHHTFGFPAVVTRCSNNFGPYQFPEKVIPLFVTNLIDGRKVPLYGDGRNVRDWLHVEDHCEAILRVIDRGKIGETYNIGGNNERSNNELTHMILEELGCGREMIQPVVDRLGHDRRYAIDATKIREQLGWEPTRSAWPEALARTIEWYKANESWWRPLKERHALVAAK